MRVFAFALLFVALLSPAMAEDVYFDGDVGTSCSIEGHVDGELAIDQMSGGTTLTSESPYGTSGSVTVRATGTNYINVAAPTRTGQAGTYNGSGEQIQVKYAGEGALASVTQSWTATGTSKTVTALLADDINIDNRIINTATGFPIGTYQTRTVVTCTPTAQF